MSTSHSPADIDRQITVMERLRDGYTAAGDTKSAARACDVIDALVEHRHRAAAHADVTDFADKLRTWTSRELNDAHRSTVALQLDVAEPALEPVIEALTAERDRRAAYTFALVIASRAGRAHLAPATGGGPLCGAPYRGKWAQIGLVGPDAGSCDPCRVVADAIAARG